MIIEFEKDEFNYYATALIFGIRSPKINEFKAFSFPTLRRYKEIKYSEHSGLNSENRLEIKRNLRIDDKRGFTTDHSRMSSEISSILTFIDSMHSIHVSDSIFSDLEFEHNFECNWDNLVKNKIKTMGILIRSIYQGKVKEIPILISEFPHITKILLQYPDFWMNEI